MTARLPDRPCDRCGRMYWPQQKALHCSVQCSAAARARPAADRFWEKVDKTGDCWLWTGAVKETGYGAFRGECGRTLRPHRFSFQQAGNVIPPGMDLCHACDNRLCVNPSHLFVGTRTDNMQDCKRKGRLGVIPVRRGEANNRATLTWEKVRRMRSLYEGGQTIGDIAILFAIDRGRVHAIVRNVSWREDEYIPVVRDDRRKSA